jgi:putative phosphoesterase
MLDNMHSKCIIFTRIIKYGVKKHKTLKERFLSMSYVIGVISDTHGLLRPEAVDFLKTCDAIIHAGDIGSEDILIKLKSIAPTYAVRGNIDWEPYAQNLPGDDVVQLNGKNIYIIHILDTLDLDPKAAGFDAVIFGHSHHAEIFRKEGVLYLNPGSAGYRRFTLPVSMAKIVIDNSLEAEIITFPASSF